MLHLDLGARAGVYLLPVKDWGLHYLRYQAMDKPMPVAFVYGWDPALLVAACLPFPSSAGIQSRTAV